jgi:hypothetical protein
MKRGPNGEKDENLPAVQYENLPAQVEQEVEKQPVKNVLYAVWSFIKLLVYSAFIGFLPTEHVEACTEYPQLAKFESSLVEMALLFGSLTVIPQTMIVTGVFVVILFCFSFVRILLSTTLLFLGLPDRRIPYGPTVTESVRFLVSYFAVPQFIKEFYLKSKQARIQKLIEEKKAKELGQ